MCVVEVGPSRLLPSTKALSLLSVLGVLSPYLPTRRAVETWIGGSVGIASGSMDSLRRTPLMYPNNSSYWGGLLGSSLYSMVTRLYVA